MHSKNSAKWWNAIKCMLKQCSYLFQVFTVIPRQFWNAYRLTKLQNIWISWKFECKWPSKCNSVNCQIIVQINWSEKSKAIQLADVCKMRTVFDCKCMCIMCICVRTVVCSLLLYCITYWHWDMSQNMWQESIFSTTTSRLAFDSIAFGSWKAIWANLIEFQHKRI